MPEEAVGAVVFLASDDANVAGITIPVEGGACVVDSCGAAVSSSGINWGE